MLRFASYHSWISISYTLWLQVDGTASPVLGGASDRGRRLALEGKGTSVRTGLGELRGACLSTGVDRLAHWSGDGGRFSYSGNHSYCRKLN